MKRLLLLLGLVISYTGNAQEIKEEPKFGINFSGFVKTDIFFDTRQSGTSTGLREGHFYLFPDNSVLIQRE